MAVVKFSRKEFEKYVRISKEIEEKISLFGTPLESLDNKEIAIEIFPNRPDLLSLQGYMRSFLSFLGKKPGMKIYNLNKPEKDYEVKVEKSVNEVRPYTVCAIVKKLNFDDEKIKEVIDIQEKIHATLGRNRKKVALGIYPLEKISLPIKYEARKPKDISFVPLGSSKEMKAMEILQENATGKEYAHLLQGKDKFPVFVDSKNEILSMPPVINSEKTGKITKDTREVFIECSGFDLEILKKTLNIIVTMLADMQGQVYQMKINYKKPEITPNLEPEKIKINIENINKLLGTSFDEKQIKILLEKMGYEYKNKEVLVPAWRIDILHEVDIAEDIAIAYGYEKFVPEIPEISTTGQEDKREKIKKKISEILAGLNMLELSTYHLLTKQDFKKCNRKTGIEVEKSKTDYTILRPDLLCSMLRILSENVDAEYPQKIFEIGKIFKINEKEETGISESEHLIAACCASNFNETKQILDYLARMLNINLNVEEASKQGFIEGRTGKIIIDKKEIGTLGEIHPTLLRNWHLKMPLSLFEISLEEIFKQL